MELHIPSFLNYCPHRVEDEVNEQEQASESQQTGGSDQVAQDSETSLEQESLNGNSEPNHVNGEHHSENSNNNLENRDPGRVILVSTEVTTTTEESIETGTGTSRTTEITAGRTGELSPEDIEDSETSSNQENSDDNSVSNNINGHHHPENSNGDSEGQVPEGEQRSESPLDQRHLNGHSGSDDSNDSNRNSSPESESPQQSSENRVLDYFSDFINNF